MLSKKAKYAIKALVYLAKSEKEGPVLISDIAKGETIPQKFLEFILPLLINRFFVPARHSPEYSGWRRNNCSIQNIFLITKK